MIDSNGIGLLFTASGDTDDAQAAFNALQSSVGGVLKNVGEMATRVGTSLTIGLTAPLVALGTFGVKAALGLDEVRTKITALVGDSAKANQKIIELYALADKSVGVFRSGAVETFAQLKGIGGIGDATINKLIGSLGKLNAAFKIEDMAGFNQNLNQIFSQGFERADIKEAIGRVPFFEQLLEQAFGTKDAEKLKKLKDSGKLSLDGFLSGLAGAIDTDPRIANIQENLSVKLAKGMERLNTALAPLGDVILNAVVPAFEAISPYLESLFKWFAQLSPVIQQVIVGVGAFLAALGPALIIVGGLVSAISAIVASAGTIAVVGAALAVLAVGITAAAGVVYGLVQAWKNGWGQIASTVAIAVGSILTIINPLLGLPILIGAVAVTIFKAWQTNFGGIQVYTLAAWEAIKNATVTALNFLNNIIQQIGGGIIAWWKENSTLIKETFQTVFESIKTIVRSFLAAVQSFWASHGAGILSFLATYWNVVKGIFSTVMAQIGGYIRLGLQLIKGDWTGAWTTFQNILQKATATLVYIWVSGLQLLWKGLKAIIPIIVEWLVKFHTTVTGWLLKIVAYAVYIIATLPYQLIKLIPKFYAIGWDIAKAIWDGIKEGLGLAAAQNPITVPVNTEANVVTNEDMSGTTFNENQPQTTPTTSGGADEAEKRRKAREEAFKKELAAQSEKNQLLLQAERDNFAASQKEWEDAFIKGTETREKFQEESLNNIALYETKVKELLAKGFQLDVQGKTGTERENIEFKYQQAVKALERETAAERADIEKSVTENKKVESEKRTAKTVQELKDEISLRTAANATINARNERDVAQGIVTEKAAIAAKMKMEADLLDLKLRNLKAERDAYAIGSEERKRLDLEVQLLTEEIDRKALENSKTAIERKKQDAETEKRLAEEVIAIRQKVLETEREILNFRSEQTRKSLTNVAETATGKAKIQALINLRDFELGEETRKEQQRVKDLEAEHNSSIARLTIAELEAGKREAIDAVYREKALLSEAEFQARLKEIKDSFNPQIESAEGDAAGGGLFGGMVGGLGLSIEGMLAKVEPLKGIGNIIGAQFNTIAQAVGNAVRAFVLFGSAGGGFRKFAAEVIASVAQMAVVQALWEMAQWAAMVALLYFTGNPKYALAAGAHLTAAIIYGAVGGVAMVAGRAMAGNAFKNETSGAYGSSGGTNGATGSSGQNSSSEGQGSSYSSMEEQTVEQGRNSPGVAFRHELVLNIKDKPTWFGDMFEANVESNGKVRNVILRVVES